MDYEQSLINPKEIQIIGSFLKFLENRFQSLESADQKVKQAKAKSLSSVVPNQKGDYKCIMCKQFLQMLAVKRLQFVQKHKLYVNCLKSGLKLPEPSRLHFANRNYG